MRRMNPMMAERYLWDRFLFQVRESRIIPEGGKLLDVGTGHNTTTLEMFGDVYDVTPSDINVGDWNTHIPGMIQMDAEHPPGEFAESWDGIMLSEVLEHVGNPMGVLNYAYQMLRWGGVLIITTPFMYRIHESDPHDPETSEPGLKDFWRFTPNGMALLLDRTMFDNYWVGRLVEGDRTDFPAWECPMGIVAWAQKRPLEYKDKGFVHPVQEPEDSWFPELPADWREQQTRMAEEYGKVMADVRQQMEPV
jgi:SAM-dependent methyltransferase